MASAFPRPERLHCTFLQCLQQFITEVINEVGCDISLANVGRVRLSLGHGRSACSPPVDSIRGISLYCISGFISLWCSVFPQCFIKFLKEVMVCSA